MPRETVTEIRHWLDLEHRCGIPNNVTYHFWVWVLIIDGLAKYLLFHTDLLENNGMPKGITHMYSQLFMTLGVLLLYIYYFFAGSETTFVLIYTYKYLTIMLWTTFTCYTLDATIFMVEILKS